MENPSNTKRPTFQAPAITIPTPLLSSPTSSSSSPPRQSSSPPATVTSPLPLSPPTPAPQPVVLSPCAACKILRRRCVDKCVLAPYFPPTEPHKFTIAHRVFGASNIIKFLQELPESQRADAVSSMVYEANARLRDPVYGCAGVVCHLQKQVSDLQAQLAKSQAELLNLRAQHTNLVALICMEMSQHSSSPSQEPSNINQLLDTSCFLDENVSISTWEPLWA